VCIERFAQLNQRPLHTSIYYVYKINALWLCSNKLTFCRETGSTQPVSRRTTLVRSAGSTLASTFFLHLTTRLGRLFFKLIETICCKLLLWFVIKLCLKRSSILRSLRWMAWKRTCMPRGQILLRTQNFIANGSLALVAQSVRRKVDRISLVRFAGSTLTGTLFLHLTARLGRLFFFFLSLLIIFSWKSKSDSPSQENQQLKQAKQSTQSSQRGYWAHIKRP